MNDTWQLQILLDAFQVNDMTWPEGWQTSSLILTVFAP